MAAGRPAGNIADDERPNVGCLCRSNQSGRARRVSATSPFCLRQIPVGPNRSAVRANVEHPRRFRFQNLSLNPSDACHERTTLEQPFNVQGGECRTLPAPAHPSQNRKGWGTPFGLWDMLLRSNGRWATRRDIRIQAKQFSTKALSRRYGVAECAIRAFKKGRNTIRLRTLRKLIRAIHDLENAASPVER